MPATLAPAQPLSWPREITAGIASSITVVAVPLTLGMLAFAGLGPAAASVGIPAALSTVACGGLVMALLSNSRMPSAGPTSATALILAGLVNQVLADPAFNVHSPGAVAALLALTSCAVALMGLQMLLFGAAGFGTLVRYVPRPVLSGFMNGVALMIVLVQLPALLGVAHGAWAASPAAALSHVQPATLAVGVATVAAMLLIARWRPQWPASLIALLAGSLLYLALAQLLGPAALGGLAGTLPASLPLPLALAPLFGAEFGAEFGAGAGALLLRHAGALIGTSLALGVIGSLETVLNLTSVDLENFHHSDPNRELRVAGLSNLAVAAVGGLPGPYVRLRAVNLLQLGGRTRWASVVSSLTTAVLMVAAAPLLSSLPRVVLAAVMAALAFALFDRWTWPLLRQWRSSDASPDVGASLAVVLAVLLVTVFAGFVVAVGVGLLLSMLLFIRTMNRSLVRSRVSGLARPSRRIHPPAQEALLAPARQAVEVLELEGALYFGSAQRLEAEFNALRDDCRHVVLDLRRVSTLEASGVSMLQQLAEQLRMRRVELVLAGLQPEPRRMLANFGGASLLRNAAPDTDRAVEAIELRQLEATGQGAAQALPLADCELLRGLDAAQAQRVMHKLKPRALAPGERLFAEGDAGDALFVVGHGTVDLLAAAGDGPQRHTRQRYLSVPAGMMLGETALLDGGGRTADAVAADAALVYALSADDLQQLCADDPALAATLMFNIARHLSQRLRAAAAGWREHAA